MSTRDDGGPAFPRSHAHDGHNGMTLRDYFAASALQGYLASYAGCSQIVDSETAAEHCYRYADAMLNERAK